MADEITSTQEDEDRKWIEGRYGSIQNQNRTLVILTVPVFKGVSIGVGFSESEALASLRKDLTVS